LYRDNIAAQLAENEHISQLLKILHDHDRDISGITALLNHVSEMESFIKSAESKISDMKSQLDEIKEIQNHPVKHNLQMAIKSLEAIVADMKHKLNTLKVSIIDGSKKAVTAFKEKGISALSNIASFFKIRQGLENWKENIETGIRINDKTVVDIERFSMEYHSTGRHLKNMARIAIGKAPLNTNKEVGKLAKIISSPYKAQTSILKRMKGTLEKSIQRLNQLEKRTIERKSERTGSPTLMERLNIYKEKAEHSKTNLPAVTRAKAHGAEL